MSVWNRIAQRDVSCGVGGEAAGGVMVYVKLLPRKDPQPAAQLRRARTKSNDLPIRRIRTPDPLPPHVELRTLTDRHKSYMSAQSRMSILRGDNDHLSRGHFLAGRWRVRFGSPVRGQGFGSRLDRSESEAVDRLTYEHNRERSGDAKIEALEGLAVHR